VLKNEQKGKGSIMLVFLFQNHLLSALPKKNKLNGCPQFWFSPGIRAGQNSRLIAPAINLLKEF